MSAHTEVDFSSLIAKFNKPSFPVTGIVVRGIEGDTHSVCIRRAWSINAVGANNQEQSLTLVSETPEFREALVKATREHFGLNIQG